MIVNLSTISFLLSTITFPLHPDIMSEHVLHNATSISSLSSGFGKSGICPASICAFLGEAYTSSAVMFRLNKVLHPRISKQHTPWRMFPWVAWLSKRLFYRSRKKKIFTKLPKTLISFFLRIQDILFKFPLPLHHHYRFPALSTEMRPRDWTVSRKHLHWPGALALFLSHPTQQQAA